MFIPLKVDFSGLIYSVFNALFCNTPKFIAVDLGTKERDLEEETTYLVCISRFLEVLNIFSSEFLSLLSVNRLDDCDFCIVLILIAKLGRRFPGQTSSLQLR